MPLLGQQPQLADFLSHYPDSLPCDPTAIVVVTAHWESARCRVSAAATHSLLFDYGGFPPESYAYSYPAAGDTKLASRIQSLLEEKRIPCDADTSRGWDHGVFIPLMLMYPNACIPVVALSLNSNQDAATHIVMGEALQQLRDEGVLILGSGVSFHNFGYFFARDAAQKKAGTAHSIAWDTWLTETLCSPSLGPEERRSQLAAWEKCPSGREAHPKGGAEHLMPIFVVFGAARGCAGRPVGSSTDMFDIRISQFEFP